VLMDKRRGQLGYFKGNYDTCVPQRALDSAVLTLH